MEQNPNKIKEVAMKFDNALTSMDTELILPFFAENCEIELLGVSLKGREGAKRWLNWMFQHIKSIELEPVIIMVEENVFFEEFIVKASLHDGTKIESKQAEVLIYENYKVKSLRLYFDRLDFAKSVANGFLSKNIIKMLIKKSLIGLI